MINIFTFYTTGERALVSRFGQPAKEVNPWEIIKNSLEYTDDTVIFLVTRSQTENWFMRYVHKYDLEKYLIVDHRTKEGAERGITNRNYPEDKLKLKLFVFKGKGEKQNA